MISFILIYPICTGSANNYVAALLPIALSHERLLCLLQKCNLIPNFYFGYCPNMTFEEEEKTKLYHSNFATYLCMMICLCSIGKHSLNKMWLYLSFPLSRYVFFSGQFTFSWKDFVERQFGQSDSDFSLLNFFWIEHFLYFPSTMYGLQISFFLSLFKASRVWKILMTLSKQQVSFGIF